MNFIENKGQVLVESIIALTVLTLGFLSLIGLLNSSIGLTKIANENYIATYLAAEGIEVVKNIIDNNRLNPAAAWNQSLGNGEYELEYNSLNMQSYQDRFLKFNNQNNTYNYSNGVDTIFKRKIIIQNLTDAIKVASLVSWKSRGGVESKVQLEDVFYNY